MVKKTVNRIMKNQSPALSKARRAELDKYFGPGYPIMAAECSRCGRMRPLDAIHGSSGLGPSVWCKECVSKYPHEWDKIQRAKRAAISKLNP